jgi:hypothetical protein
MSSILQVWDPDLVFLAQQLTWSAACLLHTSGDSDHLGRGTGRRASRGVSWPPLPCVETGLRCSDVGKDADGLVETGHPQNP